MADIKIYGKLKNATESGKVADYSDIDGAPEIAQATGQSTEKTMSQKAITDAINAGGSGGGTTYSVVEVASSATTLTSEQYNTLIASPFNKIKAGNTIYDLYQETTTELVYTANYFNNGYRVTITKTTKAMTKGSLNSLTSISNYVKNSLDYNVSNTTFALSAYQGKVLNDRLTTLENAGSGSSSEPIEQETMFSGQYNIWYNGDFSEVDFNLDTSTAGLTHAKIETLEFTFTTGTMGTTSSDETSLFQISLNDISAMIQSGTSTISVLGGKFNLDFSNGMSLSYDQGTFNYSISMRIAPNWNQITSKDYAQVSTGFTYRGFKFANGSTY